MNEGRELLFRVKSYCELRRRVSSGKEAQSFEGLALFANTVLFIAKLVRSRCKII